MGKKKKTVFALAEDFQAVIAMIPRLEVIMKAHKEIAAGYQKYRKNGGAAIPGVEKHVGVKEPISASPITTNEKTKLMVVKAAKKGVSVKTAKNKIQ
ncbi:MAG: hypothetical protein M0T70_17935 [Geobacteraceae bacterium]|nr:hypothetical protein [Geobacteraceae bacterium]